MLYFPQLSTGALAQYPLKKTTAYRTVVNTMEDESRIVLADTNAASIHWDLSYTGMSDAEANALVAFFASTEGRLQAFTFFDPAANLLGWSEALDQPAWQKNSFLTIQSGVGDPLGTHRATTITDSGAGGLMLGQELSVPAILTCCFSFYARSGNRQTVTLGRTSGGAAINSTAEIGPDWERYTLSGTLTGSGDTSLFQILVTSAASLDLFGLQVDAQPAPSQYVPAVAGGGVYPSARFDMDTLTVTSTAPNQNSSRMQLVTHVNG